MRDARWDLVLPAAATVAAAVMLTVALIAADALGERDALLVEGHVLGLAHAAELALRDDGVDTAPELLASLLEQHEPTVRHLRLLDAAGTLLAEAGTVRDGLPRRRIELFVGPHGRAGSFRGSGPEVGPRRGRGRGRFLLEAQLDPSAVGRPVLAAALPAATGLFGVALVVLAVVAGRLLLRQRTIAAEEAQRRRLDVLGRAGAGLAHQLRTPLATVKGSCQLVAETVTDAAAARRLHAAVRESERMEGLLTRLLDFARPPAAERTLFPLAPLLAEIVQTRPGVRIPDLDPGLLAWADREHVRLILDNLLDNAAAASDAGDEISITATSGDGEVRIVVADRGPGPGETSEELFEPYVTRRADGAGLGLPIARSLAEANGGSLVLRPRQGGGAEACLALPDAEAS